MWILYTWIEWIYIYISQLLYSMCNWLSMYIARSSSHIFIMYHNLRSPQLPALTSNVTTEPSRPPAPRSWQWLLQGPGHQPGWRPVGWWDTRHDISRWGLLNKVRHPWYDMNIWYLWFLRWLHYSWTPEPLKSVDKFSIKTPKWKDPNIDPLTSSPVTSSQAPLVVTTWSSPWDQPRSLDARYKAPRPASKCVSEKKTPAPKDTLNRVSI